MTITLSDEAAAMRAGAFGEARRLAIEHQIAVGRFFDATDFVPVTQAHVMGDTESLGEAGVAHVERLAALPAAERRTRVPTITDPRGLDFAAYRRLGQTEAMADLERRAARALEALGVLMTNTCINYQTVLPPTFGEHLAMGDTGVAIYCNSVFGARTNFEGGPSALAAGLTGLTPRYGYHLDRHRRATRRFVVEARPRDLADWGALGALIGRACNSYWEVPVIEGVAATPGSDALKQLGAAMASFGSTALFHLVGFTAEAHGLDDVSDGRLPEPVAIGEADIAGLYRRYDGAGERADVVVFSAPQLSLLEIDDLARRLDGLRVHPETTLLIATSPENKTAADRMGLTARIEATGGIVLEGVCFYQSYAREMAQAMGWHRLVTPSAKLVNIIGGYGFAPTLRPVAQCVEAAVSGRIPA